MTYKLLGEEVTVTDLQNGFGEIAMDINLYGQTIRFIAYKRAGDIVLDKNIIVNPGTDKERTLSYTHAVTNSDYIDTLNFARKSIA